MYRSNYERLTGDQAKLQAKIADENAKAAKFRAEATRSREEATRTTSQSMRTSKLRFAESKERNLAYAERRLGDLMRDSARLDQRIGDVLRNLQRSEAADRDRQDRQAKKRRDTEIAHARTLTREAERQAVIRRSQPPSLAVNAPSWPLDHGVPWLRVLGSKADAPRSPLVRPRPRGRGRPRGPYLIPSRKEIETAYRELWREAGRRPYWKQVAQRLGVDDRTLRNARDQFEVDPASIALDGGSNMTTV
jgi:hypothetical protein